MESSGLVILGGALMAARGSKRTACAFLTLALLLTAVTVAGAWYQQARFPIKVRVSGESLTDPRLGGFGLTPRDGRSGWATAAGQSRGQILCPRRDYSFALGMRPWFSTLTGSLRATSRGGEGSFLNLHGHLRLPNDLTQWDFYSRLRMWDKITVRLEYLPWVWSGPGNAGRDGNFAGVVFKQDDPINSSLNITTLGLGADYDVQLGRDLVFGPNGELNIIKWVQRVETEDGRSGDFLQTILQPAIGAHVRYDPRDTGYFSWFNPSLEGRFTWMSFAGLGMSTWDMAAGIAPPLSRNVDGGLKLGYKQWKLDGQRGRLLLDVGVEGLYLDFSLRF